MEIWLENMMHIEQHNFQYALGHKSFSLGMNHYGDLRSDEFGRIFNGFLGLEHKEQCLLKHEQHTF